MTATPLLDTIHYPTDLRQLPRESLPQLAHEVRLYLMESIAQSGGHFASNLGTVELTIALHYVFNTPEDHLVWDVGHQAYVHKILTGRREQMPFIRQKNGPAPFPKRSESEYDTFGVGHSSTSIGAGLGMAVADKLSGSPAHCVAIIGDGAMTAGQAFEALNNAGGMKDTNLLVILNDNEMSISENVGALPKHLAQNALSEVKSHIKEAGRQVLSVLPGALDTARQIKSTLKEIVNPSFSLFNNFGFDYIGPIDGHDVLKLVYQLEQLKHQPGPRLLHILTKKGKGYAPAENDPIGFHAIGQFDAKNPPLTAQKSQQVTYTQVFSDWLCDCATIDENLVAITPAMREGSGLVAFSQRFADRYFDVGIAEQHAVTFAGGLACEGKKPVVAIYSTFLQRAYDQLIHDIALQNLPVLFAVDRAGIVGADGPTHAGAYDLSFVRCVPNMIIATPSDENECRLLLNTCYQQNQPTMVRYPRGIGCGAVVSKTLDVVPIGQGIIRRFGQKVALLAFGSLVHTALKVGEIINATVADMRFVKPLDERLINKLCAEYDCLVTLEENTVIGGAGCAVLEYLAQQGITKKILQIGIPDIVTAHGTPKEILQDIGLDEQSILKRIQAWCLI